MSEMQERTGEGYVLVGFGSRTWQNFALICNTLDQLVEVHGQPVKIYSGGAKGADSLVKIWAKKRKMKERFEELRPRWKTLDGHYNPQAGLERNTKMIQKLTGPEDRAVAFLDRMNKSSGTRDSITKARAQARALGFSPDPDFLTVVCDPPIQMDERLGSLAGSSVRLWLTRRMEK